MCNRECGRVCVSKCRVPTLAEKVTLPIPTVQTAFVLHRLPLVRCGVEEDMGSFLPFHLEDVKSNYTPVSHIPFVFSSKSLKTCP